MLDISVQVCLSAVKFFLRHNAVVSVIYKGCNFRGKIVRGMKIATPFLSLWVGTKTAWLQTGS